MIPSLSIADVDRIASLAHLELTDEEKVLFARQLAGILAHADQVRQIDTTGVAATAHVSDATDRERADEPRPCLGTTELLQNAPDREPDAGLFRVPRVIGG